MTGPQLAFRPEPIDRLAARLGDALARVFTDPTDPQILHRRHTFDFADGFRLIVSRDWVPNARDLADVVIVVGLAVPPVPALAAVLSARTVCHFLSIMPPRSRPHDAPPVFMLQDILPASVCLSLPYSPALASKPDGP